jgi:hypothetical protein
MNSGTRFAFLEQNYNLAYQLARELQKTKQKDMLKSTIIWDITPCSPLKVNRRFGGTCRLHLQGRIISRARYQHESRANLSHYF